MYHFAFSYSINKSTGNILDATGKQNNKVIQVTCGDNTALSESSALAFYPKI